MEQSRIKGLIYNQGVKKQSKSISTAGEAEQEQSLIYIRRAKKQSKSQPDPLPSNGLESLMLLTAFVDSPPNLGTRAWADLPLSGEITPQGKTRYTGTLSASVTSSISPGPSQPPPQCRLSGRLNYPGAGWPACLRGLVRASENVGPLDGKPQGAPWPNPSKRNYHRNVAERARYTDRPRPGRKKAPEIHDFRGRRINCPTGEN